MNHRAMIAALVSGIMLASCSQGGISSQPVTMSADPLDQPFPQQVVANEKVAPSLIYVGNLKDVTLYGVKSGVRKGTIKHVGQTGTVVFDSSDDAYITDANNRSVNVYHGKVLLRHIHVVSPRALALDSAGDLYVLQSKSISVYPSGGSTPIRTISNQEFKYAGSIALDTLNNLYVAITGENFVEVYSPGSSNPSATISQGISAPIALALDASDNLYVANEGVGRSVTVYALGTTHPLATVTKGITSPISLAIDASGDLYVVNNKGNVTAYSAGSFSLIRTISAGLSYPKTLAFDASGNAYVLNYAANNITVYTPDSDSVARTISGGMSAPETLSISP